MKTAYGFKQKALDGLRGNWGKALLACLIASLLGGNVSGGVGFNFNVNMSGGEADLNTSFPLGKLASEAPGLVVSILFLLITVSLAVIAVSVVVGSAVEVGHSKFNLNLVDKKELSIGTLFGHFKIWKKTAGVALLKGLYIFLWSCLFLVPGIIAAYNYDMTSFILAEDSSIGINEALRKSKEMMRGNRWRLFCLEMSFIGWAFLCVFTCGVGSLWLNPYISASRAAFYREISGTEPVIECVTE